MLSKRILVEPKELSFAIGDMEPLFGILAVYDMAKKKRLSENFYFELNSERTEKMIDRVRIQLFVVFFTLRKWSNCACYVFSSIRVISTISHPKKLLPKRLSLISLMPPPIYTFY